jgi:hypothetical protein
MAVMETGDGERRDRWLAKAYDDASAAGDAATAESYLLELVDLHPETAWLWFDLGLFAKRRRDWAECARLNQRSLEAEAEPEGDPAQWNLGIAATALGDWPTARRAWSAYGVTVPEGTGELTMELGAVPIRLNPEPRHLGETQLELDGQTYPTEVVWCRRLDPARGMIQNVPTPESGHRFGDLLLHDGEPVGTRQLGDVEVPVFHELALLRAADTPTLRTAVSCPSKDDSVALEEAFAAAGWAAEDWTRGIRMLCKACSEGTPGVEHQHAEPAWQASRDFGIGASLDQADLLLREWAVSGSGRSYDPPQRVL